MNEELLLKLGAITQEEQEILHGKAVEKAVYATGRAFTVDSKKMLERGKLIDIRAHTRFASFPRHAHNYIEMIYMCSGSTLHTINATDTVLVSQGELLFLNPHASHEIAKANKNDVAVNFIVLPQFFDIALDMIGTDNIMAEFLLEGLRRNSNEMSYLHFAVSDILPVQNLVENMVYSLVHKTANARRILETTMALLFLQLLNHTEAMHTPKAPQNTNVLVLATLRKIEENYAAIDLCEIAAEFKVSAAYISAQIKRATGKTFTENLQAKRITKANFLLSSTALSVQDVILAVGYTNTSYFHKIFRQYNGITPKEYRNSLQVK